MIVFTERYQVRNFINGFFESLVKQQGWATGIWSKEKQFELLKEIQKLNPEKATAKDVEYILGTAYYISPVRCDECGEHSWDCVQLGQEPDYESATANICSTCLKEALNKINNPE